MQNSQLQSISDFARASFTETHEVREQALRLSREIIRTSANSIRATHRGELDSARSLVEEVAETAGRLHAIRETHPRVYYAGYVEDALKEYVEASTVLAFVEGSSLPGPEDLGVDAAPYLGGLSDAVGELRRSILDLASPKRRDPLRGAPGHHGRDIHHAGYHGLPRCGDQRPKPESTEGRREESGRGVRELQGK